MRARAAAQAHETAAGGEHTTAAKGGNQHRVADYRDYVPRRRRAEPLTGTFSRGWSGPLRQSWYRHEERNARRVDRRCFIFNCKFEGKF